MPRSRSESSSSGGRPWALITGGSTGIGRELARLAAEDGWSLVLVARSRERLTEAATALAAEHGVETVAIPMDLTVAGAAEELLERVDERGIEVEFLVNNAGFGRSRGFHDVPLATQRKMLALNIGALADLCRLLLPRMLERGRGRVLNVGSGAGYVPGLGFTAYAATKAFVLHLSEGLAAEYAGTGVTVSVLCPGPVDTPFFGAAGMPRPGGIRGLALANPRAVARAGYRGALAGRVIINPGFLPRLVPVFTRLCPRAVVRWAGRLTGAQLRGPRR